MGNGGHEANVLEVMSGFSLVFLSALKTQFWGFEGGYLEGGCSEVVIGFHLDFVSLLCT